MLGYFTDYQPINFVLITLTPFSKNNTQIGAYQGDMRQDTMMSCYKPSCTPCGSDMSIDDMAPCLEWVNSLVKCTGMGRDEKCIKLANFKAFLSGPINTDVMTRRAYHTLTYRANYVF